MQPKKIVPTKYQKQNKMYDANIHKKYGSITNEYNTQIKKLTIQKFYL